MRWVFLALYLVIIAAVSVPFWSAYEIEAIYWWLGLAGLMLGCQALFIFGSGTMHLCRPIRKRRLWMPALVAAVMMVVLTGGAMLALGELAEVDGNNWMLVAWWVILAMSWVFWFAIFFFATRRWARMRTLGLITSAMISGSLAELLAAVPSHMIVSRRPGCLVGIGTMLGIVAGLYVMLFAFGPGIVLLFLRPRYRHEQLEGDSIYDGPQYRFTLKSLLILTAVVSVVLGYLTWYARPGLEFRMAARPFRQMGGHVGGDPRSGAEGVTIISLGAMNLAETEMPRLWERLESFPNLQHLDLSVTRITAAELRQIRRLPSLKRLHPPAGVTDADLSNLYELHYLQEIYLTGTQVTPAGVEQLRRALPKCRVDY